MLTTRPVTSADYEFLCATHHEAYRDVTLRQFGVWDAAKQDEFFRASWDLGGLEVIVSDGTPCGYCQVEAGPDHTHVRELVLAPRFQRRGLGTSFLQQLQAHARTTGLPIRLGTLHQNHALRLYQRLGFEERSRTDTHVLMEWAPE
jgi:ribosomal protein S18 acetylase RimI-like enzyme